MSQRSIIVWTADYSETDGQSIVTNSIISEFCNELTKVFVYPKGYKGVLHCIVLYFYVYFMCSKSNNFVLYIVISRSFFGFLRDLPILFLGMFGVRIVCHCHGSDLINLFTNKFVGDIALSLYRKCLLVVPSGHLVKTLRSFGLLNITVIENFYFVDETGDDAESSLEF